MKRLGLAFFTLALLATAFAAQAAPGWLTDPRTNCRVWDDNANSPGAGVSWSGGCVNGLAHGSGAIVLFSNGKPGTRYDGEMREGKLNGRGVYQWPNGQRYDGQFKDGNFNGNGVMVWPEGDRYEGQWMNDVAHGPGVKTSSKGAIYKGTWTNGCFKQGDRWATVGASAEQCGFK